MPSRCHPGRAMTRAELAELVAEHVWEHHGVEAPIDRKYLGRLERGEVRWPNARYRHAMRDILGAASDQELGFRSANAARSAKELESVNRRTFFWTAACGSFVLAGRDSLFDAVDLQDIRSAGEADGVITSLERLEREDAVHGGGALLPAAIGLYNRVTARRSDVVTSPQQDGTLSKLQGELGAWVGWLAYDSGELFVARRFLNDTIVHARMEDLPELEVRAMSYLVLLLNRTGEHRSALHCAESGQRIAARRTTPRVRSLLHMRAAAAHAALQDRPAFEASVAAAQAEFDRVDGADDPLWARFVTESEVRGLRGDALTVLGDHAGAAREFAAIAEHPDPRFRRNSAYYSAKLASALLDQGDITEASERALAILPEASDLHSTRVVSILDQIKNRVGPHQQSVPAARTYLQTYGTALTA